MSTYKLPTDTSNEQALPESIGGYQHLAPDTVVKAGDIYVENGKPMQFVEHAIGAFVSVAEKMTAWNVYRRLSVAKQGDCDTTGWKKVADDSAPAFKFADDGTKLWRDKDGGYSPSGYLDDGPDELEVAGAAATDCEAAHRVTTPLAAAAKSAMPSDAKARKGIPVYSGFIKYFPRAIAAVAEVSRKGNDQHNPGKPLHWDRSKSGDELDALGRHLIEAGTFDSDGIRHSAKLCWRAMASLEKELEAAEAAEKVL